METHLERRRQRHLQAMGCDMTERAAYRISEVAAMFGVTRHTVYKWIERGVVAAIRMGDTTFILAHSLVHISEVNTAAQQCTELHSSRRKRPTKSERNQHFDTH